MRLPPHPGEFVEASEINVTPFIDVMLVLLIIFMVAAPLSTVNVPVDLPTSSARSTPSPRDPVILSVSADHSIHVADRSVPLTGLATALAEAGARHDDRILLRADKQLPYGALMGVIDALRNAKYTKVALVGAEAAAP